MTEMDASFIESNAGMDACRRRVLVVEDNLADARLVREVLKDAGMRAMKLVTLRHWLKGFAISKPGITMPSCLTSRSRMALASIR